jgi:NADH-quinone oxidoreductase subunit J
MELFVFIVAGAACIAGALGVVLNSNPVHAALSLVGTLFGIAVLFIAQEANFLAAVQVIVYAGAIVVLFLFVLMLLGVDRSEDLSIEPLGGGQRIAAVVIGLAILALPLVALWSTDGEATGARPAAEAPNAIDAEVADINQLGESLYTTYLFAFEATSILLVIAVVGAVVLARKVKRAQWIDDPLVSAAAPEPDSSPAGADT